MRSLLFVFAFLSFFQASAASDLRELESCRRQCSSSCKSLALRAGNLAREILDGCGADGGGDAEVVTACKYEFYNAQDQLECIRNASSASVVKACKYEFYNTKDQLACTKSYSEEVVKTCKYNFYNTTDQLNCSQNARSKAQIEKCVSSFYNTQDRLKCLGMP